MIKENSELLVPVKEMLKDGIFTKREWNEIINLEETLKFRRKKANAVNDILEMTGEALLPVYPNIKIRVWEMERWENGIKIEDPPNEVDWLYKTPDGKYFTDEEQ